MKAYVVSLKKDTERRELIAQRLLDKGYDFEFFEAVEPSTSEQFMDHLNVQNITEGIGPGEIACALSHMYNLDTRKTDYIFMLEDDAVPLIDNPFRHGFPHDLEDGEVLLLAITSKYEWIAYNATTTKLGIKCGHLDRLSIPMLRGACAYIINKKTAELMLDVQREGLVVADAWKHFYKHGVIKKFYYAEYFLHPDDFTHSNLELERSKNFIKQTIKRKIIKSLAFNTFRLIRFITGAKSIR